MRNSLVTLLVLFPCLAAVFGCAALKEEYIKTTCNESAAYAAGINDANSGNDMQSNYASQCPANPIELNQRYQAGYKYALAHKPTQINVDVDTGGRGRRGNRQCIRNFVMEICGYDCKRSGANARCAPRPDQECMVGTFDEIACGYSCIKNSMGDVKCAQHRGENCAKDMVGNVKCGRDCRIDFGQLKCDEER